MVSPRSLLKVLLWPFEMIYGAFMIIAMLALLQWEMWHCDDNWSRAEARGQRHLDDNSPGTAHR